MFYAPKTVASMVAAEPKTELYSDLHKDAFGCRPGVAQGRRYDAMSPVETAVEHARLQEWSSEGDRIEAMRVEVARFDFSRRIEYLMRREGMSELEAFETAVTLACPHAFEDPDFVEWDYVAHCLGLHYQDGPNLKARRTELMEAASLGAILGKEVA